MWGPSLPVPDVIIPLEAVLSVKRLLEILYIYQVQGEKTMVNNAGDLAHFPTACKDRSYSLEPSLLHTNKGSVYFIANLCKA